MTYTPDVPDAADAVEVMDRDEIEGIVASAVREARDWIESEIAPIREKCERYASGRVDIGHEEGLSSVVATCVRDTIRAVKPSIMRVILSHNTPVEFIPVGPEDAAMAEQATRTIRAKFREGGGFRILSDLLEDALVRKTGIARVWTENTVVETRQVWTNLPEQGVALLQQDTEVVLSDVRPGDLPGLFHAEGVRIQRVPRCRFASVPVEDFFVDAAATGIDTAYVIGVSRADGTVAELVAMGVPFDEAVSYAGVDEDEETEMRRHWQDRQSETSPDPSLRPVRITEAWMRVDIARTGTPALHRFVLAGENYALIDYEPVDEVDLAIFEIDPVPHAVIGRSLAEIILEDQDATTSVLRSILDNVMLTNNPRLEVVEGQVNLDDAMNSEIGAIVRVRSPNVVRVLDVPFVAGQTLAALDYMDRRIENKTGVTRASMGLDPDTLQSTTRAAVTATMQAAAAQVETMVRHFAEGGLTRLFRLMLKHYARHQGAGYIRDEGQYVPVDPRTWRIDMNTIVNVGLGTGREEDKALALDGLIQFQSNILGAYGPMNPLVSMSQLRNAVADRLALSGLRNPDRYLQPLTPEIEQQYLQAQQAQQAQAQPDPQMQALMAAEQVKAQTRLQIEQIKAQLAAADQQIERLKLMMQDDLERDRLAQERALEAARILGAHSQRVNEGAIRREQDAPR